ncbi:Putative HC-toxin efflux carrier TOXA [Cytospora mali]|uniref:HC-toxin efflux carrier TOXA n=1 Tax=Cytospora mali TaxID=578113 RepID=A0A194VBK3_CYTMA|nr:Putative HC-toxin efflux carrier TOXA [Valsa mali var. pyri (nom. inval.)]
MATTTDQTKIQRQKTLVVNMPEPTEEAEMEKQENNVRASHSRARRIRCFPKKAAYLVYLFVFEVGSLVCALSPSSAALIVGRAVAGLGASGIFAGGFTLLTTIIPLHKRAVWTGTLGSTFAIASIVGPILGGALTQHVTWHWCFYINASTQGLPIGGFVAVLFCFLVHPRSAEIEKAPLRIKIEGLDLIGFILFGGSVTILLLALQWGGQDYAWSSSVVTGLFFGAVLTMALFIPWQLRCDEAALIPPCCFVYIATQHSSAPRVLGSSPTQSGINYFPTVFADVLAAFIGSAIVMKVGWWNPFLLFAEAMVCLGGGLLSTIYPDITGAHWVGYQIFGGFGYSIASNLVSPLKKKLRA